MKPPLVAAAFARTVGPSLFWSSTWSTAAGSSTGVIVGAAGSGAAELPPAVGGVSAVQPDTARTASRGRADRAAVRDLMPSSLPDAAAGKPRAGVTVDPDRLELPTFAL